MMAMHMQRQTEILGSISAKMDRSIAVQGDIASGISKIGFETRMTVGGKRAGTTGAPLFAESPPMSK